jgi:hypothetical protein
MNPARESRHHSGIVPLLDSTRCPVIRPGVCHSQADDYGKGARTYSALAHEWLFLASLPDKRLHFGVRLPACSQHAKLAGLDYHKKTKCGKERCMQKNNDNRVLGRRKARHLSPEELQEIMGNGGHITLHMTSIITPDE